MGEKAGKKAVGWLLITIATGFMLIDAHYIMLFYLVNLGTLVTALPVATLVVALPLFIIGVKRLKE